MRSYFEYLNNWDKVLRFKARMVVLPPQKEHIAPHDASRRFILSFHMLDGTISIFEPKVPNSGLQGGTYLERCKVWKPLTGNMANSGKREAYTVESIKAGEVLNVFARGFELLSPDEKTIRYMELDPERFPYASYARIMNIISPMSSQAFESLQSAFASLYEYQQSDQVSPAHLKEALRRAGIEIGLHEALTIVRELSGAWERPLSLSGSDRQPNAQGSGGDGPAILTVGVEKILAAFQGITHQPAPLEAPSSFPQQPNLHRQSSDDVGAIDFAYQKVGDQVTPKVNEAKVRFSDPGHLNNAKGNKSNLVAPFLGIKQPASLWQTTNQKNFR